MAEEVQAELDRMVPALNDLQERGVFSKEEIHAIVDRRRLSEYDMRRRQPRKADYLRYLQQEMDLEKLRKLRVKRIRREVKGREGKPDDNHDHERSKHIGDQHIVQHIHLLWTRTLRKFKSDVNMYLQYAAFCKEVHAQRTLSRVYGEALRIHPHKVDLWIEAASHEFFQAGSVQNARVLMQRGLRIHPKAVNLWLQFFALELHFATKMMGRRKILQGDDNSTTPTTDGDNHDPFAIATLVFKNAVSNFPNDVNVRVKFWEHCHMFPQTEPVKRAIWQSIVTECGDNPEAWLAWAIFVKEQRIIGVANKKNEEKLDVGDVGFLQSGLPGEPEDDDADQPADQKKRKGEHGTVLTDEYDDATVLNILQKAVDKIRTEEIVLKAARMVSLYIRDLTTKGDSDEIEVEASKQFLHKILSKAAKQSFYSADLALEYARFFVITGRKEQARKCLRHFINTNGTKIKTEIWLQLAALSEDAVTDILDEASKRTPVNNKDHFLLLVYLLGAKMQSGEANNLFPLFERIILLAPGFKGSLVFPKENFGVRGLADACVQFLIRSKEKVGIEAARKVYQAILYKSTVAPDLLEADEETCIHFFSECVDVERLAQKESKRKSDLKRLYDTIVKLLGHSPLAEDFLQQKREDLASYSQPTKILSIPKMNAQAQCFTAELMSKAFEKYRVVHLSNVSKSNAGVTLSWKDVAGVFENLSPADKESWCIETDHGTQNGELTPQSFLVPKRTCHRAYCSFLVQKDREIYDKTQARLPVAELPKVKWSYEPALWMFFGRNPLGSEKLPGRPDHTDSISTDGTWHFQLSGTKTWTIRPSEELLRHMSSVMGEAEFRDWHASSKIEITCRQGDVLIINTRLWFHQTHIPPQPYPSVSYARDFWRKASAETTATMCNVDGLYVTNDIEEGVVIFTEDTMPDCSLHRSTEPNCEVVEMEDGMQAIVSTRPIKSGEFFCVANSDDEDSEGNDDDEDDDEQEEEEEEA